MSVSGNVFITINDGQGSIAAVPAASVQAIVGYCSDGTNYAIVASPTPAVFQSQCGYGTGVEASGLCAANGGTALFCKVPLTTAGAASAVTATQGAGSNASTSTLTVSGACNDDLLVKVLCVGAGAIGSAGAIQVSYDNGRTYGPVIQLPLATPATYYLAQTGNLAGSGGLTLSFAVGSIYAGNFWTFSATGPILSDANVQTALQALAGSQYGVVGWGSTWLAGNCGTSSTGPTGGVHGVDAQVLEGYLDALATAYTYTRMFLSARDASPPTAFGGSGETESAWISSVNADYSQVSARRLCVGAANWNTPSAYNNPSAGTPLYRRNIAWDGAARMVNLAATGAGGPQTHLGHVSDGSLATIVVNPSVDPLDGFIYHDESQVAGLDYIFSGTGGRFMTTTTRKKRPGVFITNPLLMSPLGSVFTMLMYGSVIDVACDIVYAVGSQLVNSDIRLNPNGTIFANDALFIQASITNAINELMLAAKMISPGTQTVVDQTNDVNTSGNVNIAVTIVARGYVLKETVTIGFNNGAAA